MAAEIKGAPKANGSIVQPSTAEEEIVVEAFLNWIGEVLDWGREGWGVARIARDDCARRAAVPPY